MYKNVFHFVLRECLISAFSHAPVDVKNGYYFVSKLTFFFCLMCALLTIWSLLSLLLTPVWLAVAREGRD
jgi:hypothetical protein